MSKGQGTITSSSDGQGGSAKLDATRDDNFPTTDPFSWTNPSKLKDPDGKEPSIGQTWWFQFEGGTYTLSEYVSG